MRVAVNEMA